MHSESVRSAGGEVRVACTYLRSDGPQVEDWSEMMSSVLDLFQWG